MSSVYALESTAAPGASVPVRFPVAQHVCAGLYFGDYAKEMARASKTVDPAAMERAAEVPIEAYTGGARMFSCGNGGSASIANRMQCDYVKGVRTLTDLAPQVLSPSTNVELHTADCLRNIVAALTWVHDHDLRTIAISRFDGGVARTTSEVVIQVDSTEYGVTGDLHQAVMQALAQYIRQSRLSADAISTTVF
jgi:phosphoheptose isomerase